MSKLLYIVLLAIPENVLILFAAGKIQQRAIPFSRLLTLGSLAGICITLFRMLPIPFGVHAVLQAVVVTVLVRYAYNGRWSMSVLASLICQLSLVIGEGLVAMPILTKVMGVSLSDALSSLTYTIIGGWLSDSLLAILCVVLHIRAKLPRTRSTGHVKL